MAGGREKKVPVRSCSPLGLCICIYTVCNQELIWYALGKKKSIHQSVVTRHFGMGKKSNKILVTYLLLTFYLLLSACVYCARVHVVSFPFLKSSLQETCTIGWLIGRPIAFGILPKMVLKTKFFFFRSKMKRLPRQKWEPIASVSVVGSFKTK